ECDKSFSYRESLITHSTVHTNIKPFVCTVCSARFSCIGNLLKHRKVRRNKCGVENVPIKPSESRPNKKNASDPTSSISSSSKATELYKIVASNEKGFKNHPEPSEAPELNSIDGDESWEHSEIAEAEANEITPRSRLLKQNEKRLQQQLGTLGELSEPRDDCYRCKLCPQQYTTQYLMARHLEQTHGVPLDCAREKLQYVKNTTKRETKYRCQYCDQSYVNAIRLAKHIPKHGPEGRLRYKCPCCEQHFETVAQAQQHARDEHRNRLECDRCRKPFTKPQCLQRHVRYAHGTAKASRKPRHMCARCGKSFLSLTALSDHERADCGSAPIYRCGTCGKHYSSYSALKMHRTVHDGARPFECSFCAKPFRTKGQVKVHERSHTGERPFRCEVCAKSFPYRESLLTHRTTHTGVMRFACADCDGKFSCITNLQSHRRTHHSGEAESAIERDTIGCKK
uniref:C2H2-type domain-containing protein n=1 Tax=Anopheles dirus TaxID=7168 RepID=A0A182NTV7_9DIPT